METRHASERPDSQRPQAWTPKHRGTGSISPNAVELSLGIGLCLWSMRRISRLDLLTAAVGATLVFRSLRRRRACASSDVMAAREIQRAQAEGAGLVTHTRTSDINQFDPIDEASAESFPGSDPPAFTGTTASPAVPLPH